MEPAAVETDYGYDWRDFCGFAPYGKLRKNGRVYLVDTDPLAECFARTRGLRYQVATVETKCFGVPRGRLYEQERPRIPAQDHSARSKARRARLAGVIRYLRAHPGSTKWDIVEAMSVSSATAWHDLALLRLEGRARDEKQSCGRAGRANAKWYAL